MEDIEIEKTLRQLTLQEKVSLTAGKDFWHTVAIPRLNIPSIRTSDGPNGVRGTQFFNSVPAACFPCGTALGSTFNQNLIYEVGELLGQECRARGVHVLLGPTINIQRGPLGGRGFESFSEDPFLSGTLAGAYCRGVQSKKVMTTLKHYVCNDQEHERMAVNSIVTQRALREIYLMPFMLAIKEANPAAVMTAYNKVNGVHASENQKLIDILRKEWRWEGLVMSDWLGTYSTSEGINAGLDLEMPGPTKWRGDLLTNAVKYNKVKSHVLDKRVRAVLNTVKVGMLSGIADVGAERVAKRPEDRALLRRVAAEAIVLLKNDDNILPFGNAKQIAVIGPNAKFAAYSGGGSACLTPSYATTPFEGISAKCERVIYAQGPHIFKFLPLLDSQVTTIGGKVGFYFSAFDKPRDAVDRRLLERLHLTHSEMFLPDYDIPGYDSPILYVDIDGIFVPDDDGLYDFGLIVQGKGQLFIDGSLLIDNTQNQKSGTAFFGDGTTEEVGSVQLTKGSPYRLRVEFGTSPSLQQLGKGGIRVGCAKRIDDTEAIREAAKLASQVEQVVVFAGLNSDWEGESFDRPNMDLPEPSDKLIEAVLDANPNAVICIQSGTPVAMPWADKARSIVQAWYGGNETGNGIADVLFGVVNPSGKLSVSIPRELSDNAAFLNWGSEGGRVLYGEDVYVGYRYHQTAKVLPRFSFGHGLSYTTFQVLAVNIQPPVHSGIISVVVQIKNVGPKDGAEVIQLYIMPKNPSIKRPEAELKGYSKVFLRAGEAKDVKIDMETKYAFSFWDEDRDAWKVEKGLYWVIVRGDVDSDVHRDATFEVKETYWWTGL